MSTGGNVPAQGVTVQATTEKKRNNRGTLGEGTRSLQMKRMWRRDGAELSLKAYAKEASADGDELATAWLDGKAHPPKRIPKPKVQKDTKATGNINIPKKKGKAA